MKNKGKGFYCPTPIQKDDAGNVLAWCKYKVPNEQGGWQAVREQVAQKVAPEKAVMTKEDWEAKEARTNKNILLQVAFKAAVELAGAGKVDMTDIYNLTISYHTWLLSHTEGQSPHISQNLAPSDELPRHRSIY